MREVASGRGYELRDWPIGGNTQSRSQLEVPNSEGSSCCEAVWLLGSALVFST